MCLSVTLGAQNRCHAHPRRQTQGIRETKPTLQPLI
ncbi:hypothetical protein E2C01_098942 [Portunus trituberculatus]|uniref:Uncharacterized protein n=1 Tax=Portunus trituberculatus TaxID=210409 RepID=A0A5B7K897_PORTR|nr:hypothetical protein [Portunus trituberculatus]